MYTFGYRASDAFWRMILALDEGTIWVFDFKEKNFDKIKIGMTSHEVQILMGIPLYKSENYPENDNQKWFWYYTKQNSGTSDFDQRWVIFNHSNRVQEIRKSFFID